MAKGSRDVRLIVRTEVEKALADMDKTEKSLGNIDKAAGKAGSGGMSQFGGSLKTGMNLLKGFAAALAIKEVAQFADEGARAKAQYDQLHKTFERIATKSGVQARDIMRELKEATGGTVSEMELMQRANFADRMGISLKSLPTLMEFARTSAKELGEDVDYMVESIVTGLGRQSPLILDNLGIKMSDLNAEIERLAKEEGNWTGKIDENTKSLYFEQAAVELANKSLKESGKLMSDVNDIAGQQAALWEDLKVKIGDFTTEGSVAVRSGIVNALQLLNNALTDSGTRMRNLAEATTEQNSRWNDTENRINDLLTVYDSLHGRQDLTEQEQDDLNTAIAELADIVPGAITGVDEYGNALDVNRDSITRFMDSQREMMKRMNKDVFKDVKKEAAQSVERIAELQKAIEHGRKAAEEYGAMDPSARVVTGTTGMGGKQYDTAANRAKEFEDSIVRNQAEIQKLNEELNGTVLAVNEFVDLETSGADKVAAELKITEAQAQRLIDQYANLQQAEAGRIEKAAELRKETEKLTTTTEKANKADEKAANDAAKRAQELAEHKKKLQTENAAYQIEKSSNTYMKELYLLEQWYQAQVDVFGKSQELTTRYNQKRQQLADEYSDSLRNNLTVVPAEASQAAEKAIAASNAELEKEIAFINNFTTTVADGLQTSFEGFFTDLMDGSVSAADAFKNFGKSVIGSITQMIAKMLAMIAVQKIMGFIAPGVGNLAAGAFQMGFAADGAYIPKKRGGSPYILGEGGSDEVVIPTNRFDDFLRGNYSLPGGYNISDVSKSAAAPMNVAAPVVNVPQQQAPAVVLQSTLRGQEFVQRTSKPFGRGYDARRFGVKRE